ncbi:MAG: nucleotide exchange factor GrpE, partial [Clostridium sp.]|nr:nucleotide exchange factor GrpE [Clostridium sp.]
MKDRENLKQEETSSAAEPAVPDLEAEAAEPESEAAALDTGEAEQKSDAEKEKDAASEKEEKKGFFSKKKDKKDEQIEELTDRLKRNMAEFDNYRKRTEKEKAAMYEVGARSVIEKLLPIVDNFERGLAAIPEGEEKSAFAEGMDKIYKQVLKMLDDMGVKLKKSVALTSYCDEEFGGGNGALAACLAYPCETYVNLDGGNYEMWATALGGGCYQLKL